MTRPSNRTKGAIIDPKPGGDTFTDLAARALRLRVRQQEILAELGVIALQGTPFFELLNHTVRLTAEGLQAELCKVLEYIPSDHRLLVRAGVGWGEGVVGVATVGADLQSPAGYALRTGKPVISNQLENEKRFRTPELLVEHGIRRAMNVILQGSRSPFGVLEVDSRSAGEFGEHDISFLQGAANILGMAIERQRVERDLQAALDRNELLLQEVNHRVKNSLQLVASMLHLQAAAVDDPELRRQLDNASRRIGAVARAHHRLYRSTQVQTLDLGEYLVDVCRELDESSSTCAIDVKASEPIEIAINRAIPIALLVNELVTNAAKYAYPNRSGCRIWVRLDRGDADNIVISVRDEGVGVPAGFEIETSEGLGMRIAAAFAQQLDAALRVHARQPGAEFVLVVPSSPPPERLGPVTGGRNLAQSES